MNTDWSLLIAVETPGGRVAARLGEPRLDLFRDRHRVLSGLFLDDQRDCRLPVQERGAAELLLVVDHFRDVAEADDIAGAIGDGDRPELARVGDLPHGADGQLLRPLRDAACRQLDVLLPQRRRDLGQGHVERPHDVGIETDLDLAIGAADQLHLPDAADALEPLFDLLVGNLREIAQRQVAAHRDLQDRLRAGVELLNHRRLGRFGERCRHERHAIAYFLGGDVAVLFEQEGDDDLRHAFDGARAELVDAADRVDRAFDLLRDLAFDLFGRRARIRDGDRHRRQVDVREQVDAQPHERVQADHGQRQDEHRRKDRPANAGFC